MLPHLVIQGEQLLLLSMAGRISLSNLPPPNSREIRAGSGGKKITEEKENGGEMTDCNLFYTI